jgi:hypothetical protein
VACFDAALRDPRSASVQCRSDRNHANRTEAKKNRAEDEKAGFCPPFFPLDFGSAAARGRSLKPP